MAVIFDWQNMFNGEGQKESISDQVQGAIDYKAVKCSCSEIRVKVFSKDPLDAQFRAAVTCPCNAQNFVLEGDA